MRRFTAVIFAILLAFAVTAGITMYEKGLSLKDLNVKILTDIFKEGRPLPKLPTNTGQAPGQEEESDENLSYDERIKKGDYYKERGFLSFAANEYVKASNLEPNRAEPYLKLLKANYELRDYKKALTNAEAVLKFRPNDYETRYLMSLIYIKLSDFETARGLLETLPASPVPDARVTYAKALLKTVFGQHDDARKLFKQAKTESTDVALDAKIDLFLNAYTEFDFTKAGEPLYLSELIARAYNKAEEYEMAIHTLKEVLKTRSDLRDGWILFGFAYLNLGKYTFAQTAFDKAYQLDPEWPTTQYFLGLTHKELGNKEDAIIFFNYALANKFEPVAVLHRHLADLYFESGEYDKAVASYEEILNMNQEDVNSFVRPVWLYIEFLKTPEKALKMAESAMAAFPNNPMAHNLLGWSQTGTKDYSEAEENLKKAIELDPQLSAAYYNLGRLYEEQGRKAPAMDAYQKAYHLDENGSIGNLAAQAYNTLLSAE